MIDKSLQKKTDNPHNKEQIPYLTINWVFSDKKLQCGPIEIKGSELMKQKTQFLPKFLKVSVFCLLENQEKRVFFIEKC